MGAAKAVATPAAVPMAVKSLWSASFLKYPPTRRLVLKVTLSLKRVVRVLEPIPPRPPPTMPPPWTKGPSFPAINPLDMENIMPTTLATNVFTWSSPLIWTPFK